MMTTHLSHEPESIDEEEKRTARQELKQHGEYDDEKDYGKG
jgi:hypothetical protein